MCLTQKREIKVSQNAKFSQNREIKVSRKFHVIRYLTQNTTFEGKRLVILILLTLQDGVIVVDCDVI